VLKADGTTAVVAASAPAELPLGEWFLRLLTTGASSGDRRLLWREPDEALLAAQSELARRDANLFDACLSAARHSWRHSPLPGIDAELASRIDGLLLLGIPSASDYSGARGGI
jgi:hypothetical protein